MVGDIMSNTDPYQMTVIRVVNPRHTAFENLIDMDVLFDRYKPEYLPFTADRDAQFGNGPDLYARALRGEFGVVAPYEAPQG